MEDGINEKKNPMEGDLNGKKPQWNMTSMEDNLNDNLNARQHQWNKTSMEDQLNGC